MIFRPLPHLPHIVLAFLAFAGGAQAQIEFVPIEKTVVDQRVEQNKYGNGRRAKQLTTFFEDVGCADDSLTLQRVKGSGQPNVICMLPGETDIQIVVGAHFDSVNVGTGAVDNWSGAALLPSLYTSIQSPPRKHTFVFVGFTDEEKGLIGSKFYAENLSEDERSKIVAMVNLDTLGLSRTKIWASRASPVLVDGLLRVAEAMQVSVEGVDIDKVGTTDSASFLKIGVPAITIHSVTQETMALIHNRKDRLDNLNRDWYYETFQLTTAFLAYLDEAL